MEHVGPGSVEPPCIGNLDACPSQKWMKCRAYGKCVEKWRKLKEEKK
jgi:hypothetical protein